MLRKFALAMAMLSFASIATAGTVIGSQEINADWYGTFPALTTATFAPFDTMTTGGSATGGFSEAPSDPHDSAYAGISLFDGTWPPVTTNNLNFVVGSSFSWTNSAFGSFSGTVDTVSPSVLAGPNTYSRAIGLDGTFTPGSDFAPNTAPATALLAFTFIQIGGAGNAIAVDGTLTTTAVPEPSTIAAGLAGILFAGLTVARRRSAK